MAVRPVAVLALAALVAAALPLASPPSQALSPALFFDHKTGNEWWVEVVLSGPAASSVHTVQAMDTGGPWVAMEKKSWGAWAASFHIAPGNLVKFRASWGDGGSAESCWFTHPAGAEQCGSTTTTTTTSTSTGPTAFDATFSNVKGNDWWIEARVAANQALAGVDARVECGSTWRPLTLREWGAWAASFHIAPGSKVDLRARAASGATDLSGGYVWPQATATSGCGTATTTTSTTTTSTGPAAFDATFSGVSGNEWWIQANVAAAGGTLSRVDVSLDGGAWRALAKQSWGPTAWAASYHAPPGTVVQLRATSSAGATDLSSCYLWTSAQAAACMETWPKEGTFVKYETYRISYDLERGVADEGWANITVTYTGGQWRSTCTERYVRFEGSLEEPVVNTTTVAQGSLAPPVVPGIAVGAEGQAMLLRGCALDGVDVQRQADGFHALTAGGKAVTVAARDFRQASDEYDGEDADVRADRVHGLALYWGYGFADYLCECYWEAWTGRVVDTNVPVAPQLSREQQRAGQPAWPVAGSHASYFADSVSATGWTNSTYVELEYSGSSWSGTCQVTTYKPGQDWPVSSAEHRVAFAPLRGPAMAAQGSTAAVTLLRGCAMVAESMRVLAPEVLDTYALSDLGELRSIEAVRGDEDPDGAGDEDAWWDPETGLLLRWHWEHGSDLFHGELLRTDAPLR